MKKLIVIGAIALSMASAFALPKTDDLWILAATDSSTGDRYSVFKGSGNITKNDNGVPVFAVRGRVVKKSGDTIPQMWYVPLESCSAGTGPLVLMDFNGKYLAETTFAFGSGTVGSGIAELLCAAAESALTPSQSKPAPKKQSSGNNSTV